MPFRRPRSARLALAALAVALLCAASPARAAAPWLIAGDIHFDPGASHRTLAPAGADTDAALLDSTVAAMRRTDPDAPVVVLTGDFLAHRFERSDAAALSAMRRIARAFDRAFPRAQFLVALGNNDDPCGDYRPSSHSPYLAALARIWAPLVDRRGAAPAFSAGFARDGYYAVRLPDGPARAIVLNSVLWSWRYAPCAGASGAGDAELTWLARALDASPAPALLVMHVPPGVDATTTGYLQGLAVVPFFTPEATAGFTAILARSRARVAGAIAGHEHRDDLRIVAGVPVYVASSISPIYGNSPTFYTAEVGRAGIRSYRAFRLAGETWRASERYDRSSVAAGLFARCAQRHLGADFEACAGVAERRGVAALVVALLGAALVSLPLLGLRRGRRLR